MRALIMVHKKYWLLIGMLCLTSCAVAQRPSWKSYYDAGFKAHEEGRYVEAERLFLAALREAEGFGAEDSRLAMSLNLLGVVYDKLGSYAKAEPLYKRAIAIWEKAGGPEDPGLATSLNNLAELYRQQRKYTEAEALQKRALAIREKTLPPQTTPSGLLALAT